MKITIQLNPVTKKNSQQIIKIKNRYMIIPSKQYKQYEKDVKQFMPDIETINYPVNVKCLYFAIASSNDSLRNIYIIPFIFFLVKINNFLILFNLSWGNSIQ